MFKWKDTYSTGIAEIDTQHRRLFEIGAEIYEIASIKDDFDHYDEIMQSLEELKEYTIYHFSFEEELMMKYDFDQYETHKVEHAFFVKKLQKIARKDLEEGQADTLMALVHFVADWVTGHILDTDMNYRECLKRGMA
jgi:hemerythrin